MKMARYIERIKEYNCYKLTQQVYNSVMNKSFTHPRIVILEDGINIITNNGLVPIDIGQWVVVDNLGNATVMDDETFSATFEPKP